MRQLLPLIVIPQAACLTEYSAKATFFDRRSIGTVSRAALYSLSRVCSVRRLLKTNASDALMQRIARGASRPAKFIPRHIGLRDYQQRSFTPLDTVDEASELTKRQAELEFAMKQPGGARVIEEKELREVKRKLGTLTLSSRASRCSLADLSGVRIETTKIE
jgi:hypothetical protein